MRAISSGTENGIRRRFLVSFPFTHIQLYPRLRNEFPELVEATQAEVFPLPRSFEHCG